MKLNLEKCLQVKITRSKLIVLKYLVEHYSKDFLLFNLYNIQKETNLSSSSIYNAIRFLSHNNIIEKKFDYRQSKLYTKPNSKYIIEGNNKMLIDADEQIEICKEADLIAKNILKKYPQYFSHRVMRAGKITNLYKDICHCICDIYNGSFLNSRLYDINYSFDWKSVLKEVRGDWLKVKKLILNCLKNFDLMHQSEYLPFNKTVLKSNLKEWFYDNNQFRGTEPTSQFIECINPPELTAKHFSEKKADEIFDKLPYKAQVGGNYLFSLNENMASGKFWEYVDKMVEWAKMAYKCDDNMTSWLESPSDIVEQFYKYCKNNKISVSLNTCNIEKAVECNGPWVWFVQEACEEYGINKKVENCSNKNDFKKYFNLR